MTGNTSDPAIHIGQDGQLVVSGEQPLPQEMVKRHLRNLLASRLWSGSPRLARFLSYCVHATLEGRGGDVNQYSIGVDVFDKPDTFDPSVDPVVRVEAGRLRQKLLRYYSEDGSGELVRINFPPKGYQVHFSLANGDRRAPQPDPAVAVPQRSLRLAILPFQDLTPGRDESSFCEGISIELTAALSALDEVRLISRRATEKYRDMAIDLEEIGRDLGADAVVEGSVRKSGDTLRLGAELNSTADGYVLWAGSYQTPRGSRLQVEESMARAIADAIKGVLVLSQSVSETPAAE